MQSGIGKYTKIIAVIVAIILCSFASVPASGETTFTAKTLDDHGNVTVMEVTGNYDAKNPDGTSNVLARQEIAKEFYRLHKDEYDFLVIFTNFDFAMPEIETVAFYTGVKNDIISDTEYYFWGTKGDPPVVTQLPIFPESAATLKSPQLRIRPFFLVGNEGNLYKEESVSNYALTNMDRLLADALPARTLAAGKRAVPSLLKDGSNEEVNSDMQSKFKTQKTTGIYWPSVRQDQPNWRHSDLREVAYTYLYKIFNKFVEPGGQ